MRFMVTFCRLFFCLFTILVLLPSALHADWVNLSGAENAPNIAGITIEKDRVRIQLEVFVEDLMIFEELIPESFFSETAARATGSCAASENFRRNCSSGGHRPGRETAGHL